MDHYLVAVVAVAWLLLLLAPARAAGGPAEADPQWDAQRHPVPRHHPRLFGTREQLQQLAEQRPAAYQRTRAVAFNPRAPEQPRMISLGLVSAIENDVALAREAIDLAMAVIGRGVRRGHVPFGSDLAHIAFVFDLCHEHWHAHERRAFVQHLNATAAANADYGTAVFHNGWWGYKHWGIGVAAYATYHENDNARALLDELDRDYRQRAAPALELAGAGGGWAEGYYIHYWLYGWLVFCEIALRSEGVDYHALAPGFYRNRAVASMFEMYPGMSEYNSRRPIPMGDGGGRVFGGDRDRALAARRILVNRYRDDPDHQAVHAYNQQTPRSGVGINAYMDFLWHDDSVAAADLNTFRLSHHSAGAGHFHARSDWTDDATYFFFKASDRFTSHQHLDAGHFLIYRRGELAGDGGHYDSFGSAHDVNYHLRTISHNSILVHDPDENWPAIRAGNVVVNDGGQHHNFPHHNGSVLDPQQWHTDRRLYDLVDVLGFRDEGDRLYVAADLTRAYAAAKVEHVSRQVVYLRPGTFVIFDRVRATGDGFVKHWLLHTMTPPVRQDEHHVVSAGEGRLFIQTLLPREHHVEIATGEDLYRYDGRHVPPARDTGPAPQARMHIRPAAAAREHVFLHVLTATNAGVEAVAPAELEVEPDQVRVTVDDWSIHFATDRPGGRIERGGRPVEFGVDAGQAR